MGKSCKQLQNKREHPKEKPGLHPRNRHRERYNFNQLIESCPELAQFVTVSAYNDESIDFFNPEAVKILNRSLLKDFYGIDFWDIPAGYLCPPIPGRADYIHHIADLLAESNHGKIPIGKGVRCLDIGVGANCVYPIIGNKEYGWSFVGSDIDQVAIDSAHRIVELNDVLHGNVEIRLQISKNDIFRGIISKNECFDLTICNPPFHSSIEAAIKGTQRKMNNLGMKKTAKPILNFGGQNNELWCEGGEERFVSDVINESRQFAASCFWFSTLISKESNLGSVYKGLKKAEAVDVKTIMMTQGNKTSRIVAWTFFEKEDQNLFFKLFY